RIPVYDAERAAGVPLQVGGERLTADDPKGTAVPVEPDGRLPGTVLGVVGQVGVQRPGQKLVQVEKGTVSGGDRLLHNPHRAASRLRPRAGLAARAPGATSL